MMRRSGSSSDVGQARRASPAPVAVAHHPDVPGDRLRRQRRLDSTFVKPVGKIAYSHPDPSLLALGGRPLQPPAAEQAPRAEGCRRAGRPVPASLFPAAWAPADARAQACPPAGSLSTVSKNVTSSAEVRTARRPIPSAPHASMTARRVSRQPPGRPRAPGRRPPSHSAESRSTHRNSPLPGRSSGFLERSKKYSRSAGRNPAPTPPPGRGPGSGKRSSGSGHTLASSGSSRAAVTLAASCASRKPQRSPTEANGLRPRLRSRVIS